MLERAFRLTRAEYFADFFVTPVLTAFLFVRSYSDFSVFWPATFALGFAAWTLYEYALHRFVLHDGPLARIHGMHHRDEGAYVALHPLLTFAAFVASWAVIGLQSSSTAAGFSCGYVFYAVVHTLFHYYDGPLPKVLERLKAHHATHHRRARTNFGISTSLWDRIFGTECGDRL